MVLTKTLKVLSIFVVLISISVVLIERYLPDQEDVRDVGELPQELSDWFKRGKYYHIYGHRVFAIWNADNYDGKKPNRHKGYKIVLIAARSFCQPTQNWSL